MNILIVAATAEEIGPTLKQCGDGVSGADILITGVGMTATSFALGRQLATQRYDLIINAGIAGSFDRNIPLGTIVQVTIDTFAELGAEDGEHFLSITELGFGQNSFQSAFTGPETNLLAHLPKVSGITVNQVHGHEISIQAIKKRHDATTESMEGAAVFYAAQQTGIPAIQVRAVSNYVEKRNRENWKIPLAIKNLNHWLVDFIRENNNRQPG